MDKKNPAYIGVLAVIAASILVVGSLMKPKPRDSESRAPAPTQAELTRLQQLAQRRSLEDLTGYIAQIAAGATPHLVRLEGLRATGVFWDDQGTVVTSRPRGQSVQPGSAQFPSGETIELSITEASPEAPLLFPTVPEESSREPVRRAPAESLSNRDWVVAVWLPGPSGYSFSHGLFQSAREGSCRGEDIEEALLSIPLTRQMLGAGVFDLDSRLIAVVADCEDRYAALTAASVGRILSRSQTFETRLLARFGLVLAPLTRATARFFRREQAALVQAVWNGHLAAEAGLVPGDLIVALDERDVISPGDLHPLVLPVAREFFELSVLRFGTKVRIVLPARARETRSRAGPAAGVVFQRTAPEFVVAAVIEDSAAARAGIRPGDRLIQVDKKPVRTSAEARRFLSNPDSKTHFVLLERGEKRWGTLLQ